MTLVEPKGSLTVNRSNPLHAQFAGIVLLLTAAAAFAQPAQKPFEPFSGQPGKDVVWVPTSQALVDKMLDMAKLTPTDVHMDLGSGDGRTVITAAKRGARSTGIEYNPDMVELSKTNATKAGVNDKATFVKADLFETDFSKATVITLFLLPDINLKLRPKILDLKPGTRIVSNTFTMGEWKDDETATVEETAGCSYYCTAHLWIVPAKVAGTWHSAQGDITLKQEFQMVQGSFKSGNDSQIVSNAKLRADQLSFTAGSGNYSGRVNGNTIDGTVTTGGNSQKWTATRR
jgi:precorrin-6B methylase 2